MYRVTLYNYRWPYHSCCCCCWRTSKLNKVVLAKLFSCNLTKLWHAWISCDKIFADCFSFRKLRSRVLCTLRQSFETVCAVKKTIDCPKKEKKILRSCVKVRILNRGWLFENVYVLVNFILINFRQFYLVLFIVFLFVVQRQKIGSVWVWFLFFTSAILFQLFFSFFISLHFTLKI